MTLQNHGHIKNEFREPGNLLCSEIKTGKSETMLPEPKLPLKTGNRNNAGIPPGDIAQYKFPLIRNVLVETSVCSDPEMASVVANNFSYAVMADRRGILFIMLVHYKLVPIIPVYAITGT